MHAFEGRVTGIPKSNMGRSQECKEEMENILRRLFAEQKH